MARNGNQETSGKAEFEEDHSVNSLHKLLVLEMLEWEKRLANFFKQV